MDIVMPSNTDQWISSIAEEINSSYNIPQDDLDQITQQLFEDIQTSGFTLTVNDVIEQNDDFLETVDEDNEDSADPISQVRRLFNVNGAKYITLSEVDNNDHFIPTNQNCFQKCLNKFLKDNKFEVRVDETKRNSKGVTISFIRMILKTTFGSLQKSPLIWDFEKGKLFFNRENDKDSQSLSKKIYNSCIVIFKVKGEDFSYHCIYYKKSYKLPNVDPFTLIKKEPLHKIGIDYKLIKHKEVMPIKKYNNRVKRIPYDIETYTKNITCTVAGKEVHRKILIPYCVGFLNDGQYQMSEGVDCFAPLLKILSKDETNALIAHNGARFDHIYLFSYMIKNGFIVEKLYGSVNYIKYAELSKGPIKVRLLDTFNFIADSYKNFCKSMGIKNGKLEDFDIVDWTKERFQEDRSWEEYLRRDVVPYGEAINKLEYALSGFGGSIFNFPTLASCASGLVSKFIYHQDTTSISCRYFEQMCREACYGGRIFCWKKLIDEPYICMDYNSLYPSAMYKFEYPVGKPQEITNFKAIEHKPFIAYFECDGGNQRKPLIPSRHYIGSSTSFNLKYVNKFSGFYTSVDYKEMIKMGYKVKFVRGFYWNSTKFLFRELIHKLYSIRKQYKKEGNDTLQQMVKILLNSMYGGFLTQVKKKTGFFSSAETINDKKKKHRVTRTKEMENGQTMVEYETNENKSRPYLAAFILSYSKRLINEKMLEIGLENFAYGDTDSLYLPTKFANKFSLENELCNWKNDYIDKTIEPKGTIFLGQKRYLLKMSDGSTKVKFAGLQFRGGNYKYAVKDNVIGAEEIFGELLENDSVELPIEKWNRMGQQVYIDEKCVKVSTIETGTFVDNEYYCHDFDHSKPETTIDGYKVKKLDLYRPEENYKLNKYGDKKVLETSLPLDCDFPLEDMESSFIVDDGVLFQVARKWDCKRQDYTLIKINMGKIGPTFVESEIKVGKKIEFVLGSSTFVGSTRESTPKLLNYLHKVTKPDNEPQKYATVKL